MIVTRQADLPATNTGHPAPKKTCPQLELSPTDGCTSNPSLSHTGHRENFFPTLD